MNPWIEEHFDEHLALLKTLAAIPAPSHQEDQRVAFLQDFLKDLGLSFYVDEAKNVVIPMNVEGRNDITLYQAHTDVVFPDLTPLPVVQEGDILKAPGVGDDTANVVGILMTLRYIAEHGLKTEKPLLFVLNSCEEGLGNLKGTRQIFKDYAGRIQEFISFDGMYDHGIVAHAVGSERWRVSCKTVGGHSFVNFGNPNAIAHLAKLITLLDAQKVPAVEGTKTTFNVGTISGGTSVNTIAQNAEMLYEYRSDYKPALAQMRAQFEAAVAACECSEAHFEVECVGERPCSSDIPEEGKKALIARADAALREATGMTDIRIRSGSTDANIPLSLGIPAVTFGLYQGDGEHTREEWLSVSSLKPGLEVAFKMILPYFA